MFTDSLAVPRLDFDISYHQYTERAAAHPQHLLARRRSKRESRPLAAAGPRLHRTYLCTPSLEFA